MLAIIIGSLDIARRRLAGIEHPSVLQCINNAAEGAERASVLTSRLLAFSRQQPLDPKVLDINKLVGGMSELLRRTIGEQVEIETVLAGGLWRTFADPDREYLTQSGDQRTRCDAKRWQADDRDRERSFG